MTRPTPAELIDTYGRVLQAEFPDIHIGEGSLAGAEAGATAALISAMYERQDALERNITPAGADTVEGLAPHAETVGVPAKGPTAARKASALEVRGVATTAIAQGLVLEHTSGLQYEIATATAIPVGGDRVLADVESIDLGAQTRLSAGEPLTFVAPPAGIVATGRLVLDIDEGGRDQEELGAHRDRVLAVWRQKRAGGNENDYTQWALSVDFVDETFIYNRKPARGWVGLAVLKEGTGAVRAAVLAERDQVAAVIEELRPISDQVKVLPTPTRATHGTLTLDVFPGSELDWTGTLTVTSYDGPAKRIKYSEPRPADIAIGDLVTVVSADPESRFGDGRPAVVSGLGVDGDEYLDLAPLAGADPVGGLSVLAGDTIVPSSATHNDVWLAVIGGLATLGPANPGGIYGVWRSDIARSWISALALTNPAVRSAAIDLVGVGPADDILAVESDFPSLDVELLVAGQWVVQ